MMNINNELDVVGNPESNTFTWEYTRHEYIGHIVQYWCVGNIHEQDKISVHVLFSQEIFNFNDLDCRTNCRILKVNGTGVVIH